MEGKEEVQLVDMVLRIRNKLAEASDQNLPVPDIIKENLMSHVEKILKTLPQDLQLVLQTEQAIVTNWKSWNHAMIYINYLYHFRTGKYIR